MTLSRTLAYSMAGALTPSSFSFAIHALACSGRTSTIHMGPKVGRMCLFSVYV